MNCSPPAPLSLEFSRQEYWSGLPFPFPGDLLDSEIKPGSSALQADSLSSEPPGKPDKYKYTYIQAFQFLLQNVKTLKVITEIFVRHSSKS